MFPAQLPASILSLISSVTSSHHLRLTDWSWWWWCCNRPDKTYVVTGGLGGFGLALLEWLGQMGARKLFVTSKRGIRTGAQKVVLHMLAQRGVQVRCHACALCPVGWSCLTGVRWQGNL